MNIEIDKYSGFCFGVVYAIEMAEQELQKSSSLYCLGDIVHNDKEVERLNNLGLKVMFIIYVYYHKRTIHYCNKFKFIASIF